MCNEVIYLEFAHYLAHEASKTSGESLKVGTVVEYLRKTINSAEDKFGKDHPAFFAVLEKSDKPNWLKGAIRQIQALMFHESLSRGEAPATQAQGIYLVHRRDLSRQWRLHGSGESLRRALVINLNGVAAGRPGEIVTLSPDVLLWDARFVCGYVSWPQVKSLKYKTVMFAAGNDRFICVLNSFACAFSAGCFGAHTYDYEGMNYFFPDLAESSAASTTIGGWIKAMSPSSNNVTYLDYHVASLPEDPTAAGERVGSINDMAAGGVCSEFALAVSGHDAEKLSTLWHYICLSLAAMVPGANVLGGWTAPPYGQLGEGAKPASYGPIVDTGVTEAALDRFTDAALHLVQGLAPPKLLGGGSNRPFALAMGATLVMYYVESVNALEIQTVTARMREAMVETGLSSNLGAAHATLSSWCPLVKVKFQMDNLGLTAAGRMGSSGGAEQTVAVVQQLSSTVLQFSSNMAKGLQMQAAALQRMEAMMENLSSRVTQLGQRQPPSTPSRSPSGTPPRPSPSPEASSAAGAASSSGVGAEGVGWGGGGGGSSSSAVGGVPTSSTLAPPLLRWYPGATPSAPTIALKKLAATTYFELNLHGKANLSVSDQSRGSTVKALFEATATADDTSACTSKIASSIRSAVNAMHSRVIGRLLLAWKDLGQEPHSTLVTWKSLSVNSLTGRIEELDNARADSIGGTKKKGGGFHREQLALIMTEADRIRVAELEAAWVAAVPAKKTKYGNKGKGPAGAKKKSP